jgi:geranylgeranyl diphosphate synthase type II
MTAAVSTTFDFAAYLEAARLRVETALDDSLGPERPESLREAMRYSLLAGGKRLRPISAWPPVNWRAATAPWPCRRPWPWR